MKMTKERLRQQGNLTWLMTCLFSLMLYVAVTLILDDIDSPYGLLGRIFLRKEHIDRRCVMAMHTVSGALLEYQDSHYAHPYPLTFKYFLKYVKSDKKFGYLKIDEYNLAHPLNAANFPRTVRFGHMVSISPKNGELDKRVASRIPFFWRVGTNRLGLCDVQMLAPNRTFTGRSGISEGQLHSYLLGAVSRTELHYRFYYPGYRLRRTREGDWKLEKIPDP